MLRAMLVGLNIKDADWQRTPQTVRNILQSLSHQLRLLRVRCAAYQQRVSDLETKLARTTELETQVAELTERLNQNSRNSSRPPSTDSRANRRNLPHEPSGKKAGGQPSRVGHGRKLKPPEEVDHLAEIRPVSCAQCAHLLGGTDPYPERHQVSEVPPTKAIITEYRRHRLQCPHCGATTEADWPAEMPSGSFGPRAEAMVAFLTGRLGASHRDVVEAVETMYGLNMGLGTVAAIQRRVSAALTRPAEAAQQDVRRQAAHHVDETGWRESKQQLWL